jgi:hypothetical protein
MPSDRLQLWQKMLSFFAASDSSDRRRILREHPEILSERAGAILIEEIADAKAEGESERARDFEEHLALLRICIRKAMEPLDTFFSRAELELTFATFTHGFPTLAERRAYLDEHPELLSHRLDAIADSVIRSTPTSRMQDTRGTFRLYRDLLRACRCKAIDVAFQEFEPPPELVLNAVISLLNASSPQEISARILARRDELARPEVRNAFNFIRAKHEDNPKLMAKVEALLQDNPNWR